MHPILISTYELGHQPQLGAELAARLDELEVIDLELSSSNDAARAIGRATHVVLTAPMLTGALKARELIEATRSLLETRECYVVGLYAEVLHEALGRPSFGIWLTRADADELAARIQGAPVPPPRRRRRLEVRRESLSPLTSYRKLVVDGREQVTGYLETTFGCRHRCLHCPVAAVFNGHIGIYEPADILADAKAQYAAGARHLSLGDPDFLSAPRHSLAVLDELAAALPEVTFDVTIKISELVASPELAAELARLRVRFVISAVESLNDEVLEHLGKGHRAKDVPIARDALFAAGVGLHPTFCPFTPWTTLDDLADIVEFVAQSGLREVVEPIQYAIELLVPSNSLLETRDDWYGPYDERAMGRSVRYRDARVPALQSELFAIAVASDERCRESSFLAIADAVGRATGRTLDLETRVAPPAASVMTESWFCCAAPKPSPSLG